MIIDASFYKEEIRSDFLVTEKRKKIWAAELQMLEKFDEICQKHNLTYYAYYGTLLGAVRHRGFIPWDDDIDVIMFRDDYEKFQEIAPIELEEPYFYQNTYTDRVIWPLSKIRDSRTTAVEPQFRHLGNTFHQGIFIDIFPFDSVEDGKNAQFETIKQIQNLLWISITDPEVIINAMEEGQKLYLSTDFLIDHLRKNVREKFKIFELFNRSCLGQSERVNYLIEELYPDKTSCKSVEKNWFHDIVYLPFEYLQIPAPAEYDKILTQCYGDYHRYVQGGSAHEQILLDPDIPYTEYLINCETSAKPAEKNQTIIQ